MKWLTSGVTNGILKGSVLSCVILCCFLLWYVFLLMVVTFLLLDAFLQYTASSPCWEHFFDQNQLIYGGVQAFWMVNMVKHCRRQQQQFLMIVSTEVSSFKELLNQGYTKVITSDHQENLRNLYQRSSGGGSGEEAQVVIWISVIHVSLAAGETYNWLRPLAFGLMGIKDENKGLSNSLMW